MHTHTHSLVVQFKFELFRLFVKIDYVSFEINPMFNVKSICDYYSLLLVNDAFVMLKLSLLFVPFVTSLLNNLLYEYQSMLLPSIHHPSTPAPFWFVFFCNHHHPPNYLCIISEHPERTTSALSKVQ